MKSKASIAYFSFFILSLFISFKAEPENSKISETFFNMTSGEEQQIFWNLHSEELIHTAGIAEPENSRFSKIFLNMTSTEDQQIFWNLHSEELKNAMEKEWEVQKITLFAFSQLVEMGEVPGYTPERLEWFKNLTVSKFTESKAKSFKSGDPIFSNVIDEMSDCESSFIIEISSQDSEIKYFICFSSQSGVEIRSAYVFEGGSWKKLK